LPHLLSLLRSLAVLNENSSDGSVTSCSRRSRCQLRRPNYP
jgi:hypothetical protein